LPRMTLTFDHDTDSASKLRSVQKSNFSRNTFKLLFVIKGCSVQYKSNDLVLS